MILKEPILVIGNARGGSTLLTAILNFHPYVSPRCLDLQDSEALQDWVQKIYNPELHMRYSQSMERKDIWFSVLPGKAVYMHMGKKLETDTFMSDRELELCLKSISYLNVTHGHRFLFKSPSLTFVADHLLEKIPQLTVFAIVRNPLAVINSWGARVHQDSPFFFEENITRLCQKYNETIDKIVRLRKESNIHIIKYEDLVNDPQPVLDFCFKMAKLPRTKAFAKLRLENKEEWWDRLPQAKINLINSITGGTEKYLDTFKGVNYKI